jgi:hypothetical protein
MTQIIDLSTTEKIDAFEKSMKEASSSGALVNLKEVAESSNTLTAKT